MPSTTTNTTKEKKIQNETNTTKKTSQENAIEAQTAKKIKEQEKEIQELKQMLSQLIKAQSSNKANEEVEKEIDINPNKKTKITSLTYGLLTLYAPNRGFLRFDNYGSMHTITYAQLVDYVNSCRSSAESGRFYIHNQDMVIDLGLSEAYEKILSDKVFEQIFTSNVLDTYDILHNTTEEQKSAIAEIVSQKVFNKEITDIKKIDDISKAINVDILDKVKEMEETQNFLNK